MKRVNGTPLPGNFWLKHPYVCLWEPFGNYKDCTAIQCIRHPLVGDQEWQTLMANFEYLLKQDMLSEIKGPKLYWDRGAGLEYCHNLTLSHIVVFFKKLIKLDII